MIVTRHRSADDFLAVAESLLMLAEAENHLIIGVAQGIARNPSAAPDPYLATVSNGTALLACAVHIAPYKVVITSADREAISALAQDAFASIPYVEAVTGPAQSATDFALAWSRLSGAESVAGMRFRIHETRTVIEPELPTASGRLRLAVDADQHLLAAWMDVFVRDAGMAEVHRCRADCLGCGSSAAALRLG